MPFTVSHAIVALPFARGRIPAAAVAIGAMVPDIGLYAPLPVARELTHAPIGVVTIDLALGVVGLLLWLYLLRAPLRALAPRMVRARLREPAALHPLPAAIGLVIGSATHVVWDAFSHVDGFVVEQVPALQQEWGDFAGYKWVQYASGVAGLVVLILAALVWLLRTPPRPVPRGGGWWRSLAWLAVLVATAWPTLAILRSTTEHPLAEGFRGYVVAASIAGVIGAAVSVLGVALLWQLVRLLRKDYPARGRRTGRVVP
ncbi:DUF4184 family protein [Microbacteriaceae bacterium VKM Ac-2854]|nr:DUF4184 family protein [Microbacteriaceae bacterium VKM Ac-2854]